VWKQRSEKTLRIIVNPKIDRSYAWGYLMEIVRELPKICVERCVLHLEEDHKIFFNAMLGEGTNNWAEVNSMWFLIKLIIEKGAFQI
jgi:hypothetical protein